MQGGDKNILEYADRGAWDLVSQQFFYIGQAHGQAWKFVAFNAVTNSWQQMPQPFWYPTGHSTSHGYDHCVVNSAAGYFFNRPFEEANVFRYDIASQTWDALPKVL